MAEGNEAQSKEKAPIKQEFCAAAEGDSLALQRMSEQFIDLLKQGKTTNMANELTAGGFTVTKNEVWSRATGNPATGGPWRAAPMSEVSFKADCPKGEIGGHVSAQEQEKFFGGGVAFGIKINEKQRDWISEPAKFVSGEASKIVDEMPIQDSSKEGAKKLLSGLLGGSQDEVRDAAKLILNNQEDAKVMAKKLKELAGFDVMNVDNKGNLVLNDNTGKNSMVLDKKGAVVDGNLGSTKVKDKFYFGMSNNEDSKWTQEELRDRISRATVNHVASNPEVLKPKK